MIITTYGLIVFQLVIWIGVVAAKSRKSADKMYGTDMLGFSYMAIQSRHEVCIEPNLREDNTVYDWSNEPTKLSSIAIRQSNIYA